MQKMGVGAALMEEGHAIAREKGFDFAFLLGHTDYYSRFGYQTGMFGSCYLEVNAEDIPDGGNDLVERPVQPSDIPDLIRMWHTWFDDVDLALFPGDSLLDWVSHNPKNISNVLVKNEKLIGYIRYQHDHPGDVKLILAKDEATFMESLRFLQQKAGVSTGLKINLPLHPLSAAIKNWLNLPYTVQKQKWDAAMICLINDQNLIVKDYMEQVKDGSRMHGLLIYPPQVEFDY
jgi:hypothetical protein